MDGPTGVANRIKAIGREPSRGGTTYSEDLCIGLLRRLRLGHAVCGERELRDQAHAALPADRIGSAGSPGQETLCFGRARVGGSAAARAEMKLDEMILGDRGIRVGRSPIDRNPIEQAFAKLTALPCKIDPNISAP